MSDTHSQYTDVQLIPAEAAYPIRHAVLRAGLPAAAAQFDGDLEPYAFHLGAWREGRVIGCATYLKRGSQHFSAQSQYQLRGMAVLPEHQGRGLGRLLLERAYPLITAHGIRLLWCDARLSAQRFYQQHGFSTLGTQFDKPPVRPHFVMYKQL